MTLPTKPVQTKRDRLLAMIRNEDAASSAHRKNRIVKYRGRVQKGEGLREQIGATDDNEIDEYASMFAEGKVPS